MTSVEDRDDATGIYSINGNRYVSVTTALDAYEPKKQAIESWKENVDNWREIRDRAAITGTLAHHKILSKYSIRRLPMPEIDASEIDSDMLTDIETCEALFDSLDFEFADDCHIEQTTYSNTHRFAGTADAISDGTVVDLKTSSDVRDSHFLQCSAYYTAINEMSDLPDVDSAAVILLNHREPEGRVERLSESELESYFETYKGVLARWWDRHG